MKTLSRILLAAFMLMGAVFAVSNRELVELRFWPLPDIWVMPLFLVIVLMLLIGVLVGLGMGWFTGRKHRRIGRERGEEADRLGREVARLKSELAQRDAETAKAAGKAAASTTEIRALERQAALVDPDAADAAKVVR